MNTNETERTMNDAMAEVIRAESAIRNWKASDLARESGIAYRTLKRYWDGERGIDAEQLYEIARALGTTGGKLFEAAEERL